MTLSRTASDVLERDFLVVRAKLLEAAAALDRIGRASGSVEEDRRIAQIREALEILRGDGSDRAERLQQVFSLPYDEAWRQKFFGEAAKE